MKKIFALSLFVVLLSSFFAGNYGTNSSSSKLSLYNEMFPLIKDEADQYIALYPEKFRPEQEGDAASNRGTFRVWYENGKGNYSTVIKDRTPMGSPAAQTKYDPLMMASILYENPRRPAGTSAKTTFNQKGFETNQSDMLVSGRHIKLFSNTPRVVSDDPMTFAISYKFDRAIVDGVYRILLKYNHAGSELDNIFIPLKGNDMLDIPTASEDPANREQLVLNSNNIPMVRSFLDEVVEYHIDGKQVLDDKTLKASAREDSEMGRANAEWTDIRFKNAVVISGLAADTLTHNLFFTFRPTSFDPAKITNGSPKVYIEAVLQKKDEKSTSFQDLETSRMEDKAADAHDPNDIIVSPECIQLPQKNTKLKYTVNFENTGGGDADSVIIVFTPPQQCTVKNIAVNSVVCGTKRAMGAGPNLIYKGHTIDAWGRIIFSIEGLLKGAYVNTKPEPDAQTKGSIDFDLDISPNGDVKQAIEMKAVADIFFHSVAGVDSNDIRPDQASAFSYPSAAVGYELPVTTDPARTFYKEECGKKPHPCLFAWWWLLILLIILIFVLWWLLRRRRRNANAS